MTTTVATIRPQAMPLASAEATGDLVIAPQSFSECIAFAAEMAKSRFVPKHLRDKPADCLAVTLQALRWRMDPFSVAQKTYFTTEGSPPGYEAQLIAAVVHARAPLEGRLDVQWDGEWPARRCTITGKLRGDPKPKARTVKAELITTRNSPLWKADPDQQLAYYTIRAWARLYTPDTIMGVYGRDEIAAQHVAANEATDITPEATATAPPAPQTRLDAIEAKIVGDDPETIEDLLDGLPPVNHDAATGEVIDDAPLNFGEIAEYMRKQLDRCETAAAVKSTWEAVLADERDTLKAGAPELYAAVVAHAKQRSLTLKGATA